MITSNDAICILLRIRNSAHAHAQREQVQIVDCFRGVAVFGVSIDNYVIGFSRWHVRLLLQGHWRWLVLVRGHRRR